LLRANCTARAVPPDSLSLHSITRSEQHIRQMRADITELCRLAEKKTLLVSGTKTLIMSTLRTPMRTPFAMTICSYENRDQLTTSPFFLPKLQSVIEVRKESNNKAIFVFTTVTVIFLPLSFVSSYLGMNTVDIRNSTTHQDLFWMISIPITASILFSLWIVLAMRKRIKRWCGRGMGMVFGS
jgi:CorA-like Mg2+ transporter protein